MKIVEKENIILNSLEMTKDKTIKIMLSKLNLDLNIENIIYNEVLKREKIENTVIGFKFAVPHAKIEEIEEPKIVYLKFKNEIVWAKDEENVKHVLLILVPKSKAELHIDILKDISLKIMDEKFRENLDNENDIEKILKLLNK